MKAGMLLVACMAVPSTDASAQGANDRGALFVEGGLLTTALINDTQESQSGYLHYAYIGALDWPVAGAWLAGGIRVARRVSVGGGARGPPRQVDDDFRTIAWPYRPRDTVVALHEPRASPFVHRARTRRRRPRRRSAARGRDRVAGDAEAHGPARLRVCSGLWQRADSSETDAGLTQTTFSSRRRCRFLGVHLGRRVAVVCSPRIHRIARERVGESTHVLPNAGRVILSIGTGVQWWPRLARRAAE